MEHKNGFLDNAERNLWGKPGKRIGGRTNLALHDGPEA